MLINQPFSVASLARYTSWGIGGPGLVFCPQDRYSLSLYLKKIPKGMPIHWLGLGSNLLISDEGVQGHIILFHKGLINLELRGEQCIYVDAGVSCAKLSKFSTLHGLSGVEFFSGIPGTVGGALAMNAGAWGADTWSLVQLVEIMDRNGEIRFLKPSDFKIGYRQVCPLAEVQLEEFCFIGALFHLNPEDPQTIKKRMRDILQQRIKSQPIGMHSCGSVFKNPSDNSSAGFLIAQSGLQGKQCGAMVVSEKHANFIINRGGGTAKEALTLIHLIQEKVLAQYGVYLTPEVRFIGNELLWRRNRNYLIS